MEQVVGTVECESAFRLADTLLRDETGRDLGEDLRQEMNERIDDLFVVE